MSALEGSLAIRMGTLYPILQMRKPRIQEGIWLNCENENRSLLSLASMSVLFQTVYDKEWVLPPWLSQTNSWVKYNKSEFLEK